MYTFIIPYTYTLYYMEFFPWIPYVSNSSSFFFFVFFRFVSSLLAVKMSNVDIVRTPYTIHTYMYWKKKNTKLNMYEHIISVSTRIRGMTFSLCIAFCLVLPFYGLDLCTNIRQIPMHRRYSTSHFFSIFFNAQFLIMSHKMRLYKLNSLTTNAS